MQLLGLITIDNLTDCMFHDEGDFRDLMLWIEHPHETLRDWTSLRAAALTAEISWLFIDSPVLQHCGLFDGSETTGQPRLGTVPVQGLCLAGCVGNVIGGGALEGSVKSTCGLLWLVSCQLHISQGYLGGGTSTEKMSPSDWHADKSAGGVSLSNNWCERVQPMVSSATLGRDKTGSWP